MLVLSREENQSIDIGNEITVTVVEVRRGRVRLGIQAPRNVVVNRREVTERIRRRTAEEHEVDGKEPEGVND
jgi:carbon storage regulator